MSEKIIHQEDLNKEEIINEDYNLQVNDKIEISDSTNNIHGNLLSRRLSENFSVISKDSVNEEKMESIFYSIKKIAFSAVPVIASLVFTFLVETINIIFIGKFNDANLLTSIGLGTFIINIIAIIPLYGWCSGIDTLCSNAYGSKEFRLVGIYACIARMMVFAYLLVLVIPFLVFFNHDFMKVVLQQSDEVALNAREFGFYIIPGLFFYCLYTCNIRYLQSMKIFQVGMWITFSSFCFHPLFAWYFIKKLDWKIKGAAISMAITQFNNSFLLLLYIHFSKNVNKKSYFYFCREAFQMFFVKEYIKYGVPGLLLYVVEAFSFEVMTVIASFLGPTQMSASICVYNVSSIGYTISNGIATASCNLVGNAVGKMNPRLAYLYTKASLIFTYAISFIIVIFLFFKSYEVSTLYTNNEEILNKMTMIFPFFYIGIIWDFPEVCLGGVNRGLGRQHETAKIWILIQYGFGIPSMLLFTFVFDFRLKGLWFSQAVNMCLVFFGILYIYKKKTIEETIEEYKKQLEKAKKEQLIDDVIEKN